MSSKVIVDSPEIPKAIYEDSLLNRESALIRLIYQSSLSSDNSHALRKQLLSQFREDRVTHLGNTEKLIRHLKRATRIGQARSAITKEREQLEKILLSSMPPIMLVNESRDIQFMNTSCDSSRLKLSKEYGFIFKNDCFEHNNSNLINGLFDKAKEFGAAFKKIPESFSGNANHSYGLIIAVFNQPDNKECYQVILFDEKKHLKNAIQYLAGNHNISTKEKALIMALLESSDLNRVADLLSISIQTARQHLKNIFIKLNINSQTALFNMVLNRALIHGVTAVDEPDSYVYAKGLAKTHTAILPNDRVMSYLEMGPIDGVPVIYFHSINASRFELLNLQTLVEEHGIRLICVDRTGYGESTYEPKDTYGDYSSDIKLLVDELNLGRVGLLSCSAGSPHALSFAEHFPERVTQVHCISAVPTPEFVLNAKCSSAMNDTLNKFFRIAPALMRPALELALLGQTSKKILNSIGTGNRLDIFTYSEMDIEYIKSESQYPYFVASLTESLRQGPKAWANENVMVNKPWQMSLHHIELEVTFWHGTNDTLIPLEMVQPFVESLPNGAIHVLEGETHLLIFRHLEKILPRFHEVI